MGDATFIANIADVNVRQELQKLYTQDPDWNALLPILNEQFVGEQTSFALCDRLSRTRDNSQRQLPTDHDYAVPTREYQTDQSSLKSGPAAARSVLGKRKRKPPKPHRFRPVDTVTPYQGNARFQDDQCGNAHWRDLSSTEIAAPLLTFGLGS